MHLLSRSLTLAAFLLAMTLRAQDTDGTTPQTEPATPDDPSEMAAAPADAPESAPEPPIPGEPTAVQLPAIPPPPTPPPTPAATPFRGGASRFPALPPRMRMKPGQPIESGQPGQTRPGHPAQPIQPAQPVQTLPIALPGQPTQPIQPAQVTQPMQPLPAPLPGQPVQPVQPTPFQPGQPPRSAWQPSQPQFTPPAPESTEPVTLEYPNADIKFILPLWEKLTGKKALYDSTVQGPCGISVTKPVSPAEAIRIIETAMLLNNFTIVPGPGPTIVRVLGASKSPRQFGPPLYTEVSQLPENDQIVSFLFKLEYADPTEVQQVIAQYVAPSPYTSVLPMPKAQALLVTENTSVIRSLSEIISRMDRKPADVVSEFITLERADAKEVIEKLNTIFEKQPTGPGGAVPAAPAPPAPGTPPAQPQPGEVAQAGEAVSSVLSEDSLIVGKIKLTADVRTNRIHVVTRPVYMNFIRSLIKQFDSDIPFGIPATRALRFVAAGDVLDVVVKSIIEPGAKEDTAGGGTSGAKAAAPVTNPSSYGGSGSSYGRYGGGSGGGGSSLGGEELTTSQVDTVPEARTVGSTKIIADKRSNSIIVLGNKQVKEKIFKILDEIDVRAPQVMLTAVIGELNLDDSKEFGVNYLLRAKGVPVTSGSNGTTTGGGNGSGFAGIIGNIAGSPTTDVSALTTAANLASTLGTGGLGINGFIGATKTLEAIVHALESTGRFRVTSRPMVFTSNNKKALIASGQEVAVPGQINSGYGGYNGGGGGAGYNPSLVSTANVEYKDVFLKLEVQPLINSENEVTLDIVQEVNSLGDANTALGGAPTINSRRIKTTVSCANNSTIVLGGLVTENKTDKRSGIPILSKIPYLGNLFSSKVKSTTRSELIVLIRPTVTNTPAQAVREGEYIQTKLNFPPDLDAALDPPGTRVKLDTKDRQKLLHKPKAVLRSEE